MKKNATYRLLNGALPLFKSRTLLFFRQKYETEEPLQSELFTPEQMENHGKTLAQSHTVHPSRLHRDRLLKRLDENEAVLEDVRNLLNETVGANRKIVPAGDWLLDNYYLIENIIHTTRRDLPNDYNRELPRLQSSSPVGIPRVYAIAIERISHGDGQVDAETLPEFINAYQTAARLTLGELWAIPIMLRLALVENLRRIAIRIAKEMHAKNQATSWADRILALAKTDPKSLLVLVADMARSMPTLNSSFVAELTRRLYGKGARFSLPLTWIEEQLAEEGLTTETLVQSEIQQQAADQVSISNTIGSLRALDANDWKGFVENTSLVEQVLRTDPSGHYAKMDFSTRDEYRHMVEKLAKRSGLEEQDIAQLAIGLAQQHLKDIGSDKRPAHVGYYLLDMGLSELKQAIHKRSKAYGISRAVGFHGKMTMYAGSMGVLSALIACVLLVGARQGGLSDWNMIPIGLLACIGAGGFASAIVNWIVTLVVPSDPLPRMDYSRGIPLKSRTLVVVPAMLSGRRTIELLVEDLEVRFLANRDNNLFFGLLSDFLDAKEEVLPSDGELIVSVKS